MNFYENHIGLQVKDVVYVYRGLEVVKHILQETSNPSSRLLTLFADAVILDGRFLKERFMGDYHSNLLLTEYSMTTSQYLHLTDQKRDHLLRGVKL